MQAELPGLPSIVDLRPESALICIGKGRVFTVLVDTADIPKIFSISRKWRVANFYPRKQNKRIRYYAYCRIPQEGTHHKTVYLHRVIADAPYGTGVEVDHINHDSLDNRRSNLRVCSHKENQNNRIDSKTSFLSTRPLGGPTDGRGQGVSNHPGSNFVPSALPQEPGRDRGRGQSRAANVGLAIPRNPALNFQALSQINSTWRNYEIQSR